MKGFKNSNCKLGKVETLFVTLILLSSTNALAGEPGLPECNSQVQLMDLPEEVLFQVLSQLDENELGPTLTVSKTYNRIGSEILYTKRYKQLTKDQRNDELEAAARAGNLSKVKVLINLGVDPSALGVAMSAASNFGYLDIVELIAEKDLSAAKQTRRYSPAVHAAAENGHLEIVKYLLQKDPSLINFEDRNGATPIFLAVANRYVINGNIDTVQFLHSQNQDLYKKTALDGFTTMHRAADVGNIRVAEFLHSIDPEIINSRDKSGRTPMHMAAIMDRHDMMIFLHQKNKNLVNLPDNTGQTPLDIVLKNQEDSRVTKHFKKFLEMLK